jgi:hypothetical protein
MFGSCVSKTTTKSWSTSSLTRDSCHRGAMVVRGVDILDHDYD